MGAPAPAPAVGNADVVLALERIAGLLEIRGENAFKVRAYRTAAQQTENLAEPLAEIAGRGGLRDLPGFGDAIARKVEELVTTGRLAYLEGLEEEIPPSLLEVRALHGVGPRTAATIWHELGITTVEDLDAAARSGLLQGVPRLGPRSIENLLGALDARRAAEGEPARRARQRLTPVVDELTAALRAITGAERVEVAGSYRRGRPESRDLDLLVATHRPAAVLQAVAGLAAVEGVLLRGDTKCSVHVDGGLQVDCRAVAPDQFGAAWQYFTGSKAHNVRLRGMARDRGLTVNEYGAYWVDGSGRVAGETEADLYACLGLRWIPPESREDRGEFEEYAMHAAEGGHHRREI